MPYYDPFVAEVRHNREQLLALYGGFEGYMKHVDADRPRLEQAGWHFATEAELAGIKRHHR
jgi:hypothetical protein